jgi:hypothetical protein
MITEYNSDGIETGITSGTITSSSRDGTEDVFAMGVIRKEAELNADERKYLMAVDRGDVPTVQQCVRQAKVVVTSNFEQCAMRNRQKLAIET